MDGENLSPKDEDYGFTIDFYWQSLVLPKSHQKSKLEYKLCEFEKKNGWEFDQMDIRNGLKMSKSKGKVPYHCHKSGQRWIIGD